MRLRAIAGVLLGLAIHAHSQETLFSNVNAYNPVPSPDGKLIAYDVTGRKLNGGSGGFGRSNLLSQIEFCDRNGRRVKGPDVEGFLGEWLPDGSAISTYRDWHFALVSPGGIEQSGLMRSQSQDSAPAPAERATYIQKFGAFVWIEEDNPGTLLQTRNGPIARLEKIVPLSALIVPSPDERYLAIGMPGTETSEGHLWTFDTAMQTLTDLGSLTIHPDSTWDYTKPSWNPWFSDSHNLTFFSRSALYVVSSDGKKRRKLLEAANAGLATASPDGSMVAFLMSIPRPMKMRPDLSFWGGTTIWVVPTDGGKSVAITKASDEKTYGLRWLSNSSLIFDRIGEGLFNNGARIWTVPVAMK